MNLREHLNEKIKQLTKLTDGEVISAIENLAKDERELLAALLHHLREIERRKLFSSLGYKSLFDYAVKRLGYSEDQAIRRISAMRLLKELPQIEKKISDGSLTLSNIGKAQSLFQKEKKLGDAFSLDQKLQVLESLENKSAREADKIVISLSSEPEQFFAEKVRAVTLELSEVKFTANDLLLQKIEKLKGLLAHSNPNISISELFDKLCDLGIKEWDLGIQQLKTKKLAAHVNVIAAPSPATSQKQCAIKSSRHYISIHTRRCVWRKAESQCEKCGSTHALEIDHIIPKAKGGADNIENLRLLCRNCNQREAIKHYGQNKMSPYLNHE